MDNIKKIGKQCVGCRSCEQSCPKQCIHMENNQEGFLYPIVDEEACINCKKCLKVCPMNVEVNKDSRKRKNGTECILCYECTKNCPTKALH